jgi:hypothetical protein
MTGAVYDRAVGGLAPHPPSGHPLPAGEGQRPEDKSDWFLVPKVPRVYQNNQLRYFQDYLAVGDNSGGLPPT